MKTLDEFRRRWRNHVAGVIGLGASETRKCLAGPMVSAEQFGDVMNRLGETADALLTQLYTDLAPKEIKDPPRPAPVVNGNGAAPKKVTA